MLQRKKNVTEKDNELITFSNEFYNTAVKTKFSNLTQSQVCYLLVVKHIEFETLF